MVYKSLHSLPHSCVSSLDTISSIYLSHTYSDTSSSAACILKFFQFPKHTVFFLASRLLQAVFLSFESLLLSLH